MRCMCSHRFGEGIDEKDALSYPENHSKEDIPMRTQVYPHIRVDERGIAYIDDTETKVITVVRSKKMSRDTPE